MRGAGYSQTLVPRLRGRGSRDAGRRSLSWQRQETAGERFVLGPECTGRCWQEEPSCHSLLGWNSLYHAHYLWLSAISSPSLGHLILGRGRGWQPGLMGPLLSPGPTCSKGAEELSHFPPKTRTASCLRCRAMAGHGWLGLGLFCWALLAVPVGPQPASSIPGAPLTTLAPPLQSEASMLSLNLGLNFKFHLRGPAAAWGNPVTETQPLSPQLGEELEEEVVSGLRTDSLWELLVGSPGNSVPEWGSAEGSSAPWASSPSLESTSPLSGPMDQPTAPYQPRMGTMTWVTALTATVPPSSAPRPHQSELELKFDVALRAAAAPTLGHRTLPLLPSLRASLAEIAGRLGPFGFFGTTLSPLRNSSGPPSPPGATTFPSSASGVSESPGFFGTTLLPTPSPLERKLSSPSRLDPAASLSSTSIATGSLDPTVPTTGRDDPSPGSFGNPSVQPECGPESCNIGELPEREEQPPAASLPLFFLTLEADWAEARARWGLAWEAHVYGRLHRGLSPALPYQPAAQHRGGPLQRSPTRAWPLPGPCLRGSPAWDRPLPHHFSGTKDAGRAQREARGTLWLPSASAAPFPRGLARGQQCLVRLTVRTLTGQLVRVALFQPGQAPALPAGLRPQSPATFRKQPRPPGLRIPPGPVPTLPRFPGACS
ncbi:proline-rich transmembrane protein 4 isoform X5 [Choloepus didactylus]|uniref:proline-rich transmembrane protein 4 isoform X5 n=1 Tax=Choloepus didactylus TaxID=27675 RepID=UPI00189FAB55|nr:proline-rich transmembrane protein 4 isoform X5 [Choloepus didactylus]